MGDVVSDDFVRLALTLIQQLPSSPAETPDETVLLRLQTLFGSMLMSALQLVDRREVLHFTLPTRRQIWQVGSSGGAPYTIYLTLPSTEPTPPAPADDQLLEAALVSVTSTGQIRDIAPTDPSGEAAGLHDAPSGDRQMLEWVDRATASFHGVYCPCTGFAYNSLNSERNIFCKHLLAILLADRMGRAYRTEVPMHNVVGLLDLARAPREERAEEVMVDRAGVKMEMEA